MVHRFAPSHWRRGRGGRGRLTVPRRAIFPDTQLYLSEAVEIAGDDVGFVVAGAIADDLPRRTEPPFQTHQPNRPEAAEVAGDDVRLTAVRAVIEGALLRRGQGGRGRLAALR